MKITKEVFDRIKKTFNNGEHDEDYLFARSNFSISTLNKIKRCKDFEEYQGNKEPTIKFKSINKKDKKYETLMDIIMKETFKAQYLGGGIRVEWINPKKPTLLQRIINLFK